MTFAQRLAGLLGHRRFLRLVGLFPPFLAAGIRVRAVAKDLSRVDVEMRLRPWNRNFVGTHFGGSLYAMCDPFFMAMLLARLGPDYVVWDKAAGIEFVRPGRGLVTASFELPAQQVEQIRADADRGERVHPHFTAEVRDDAGELVARVEKTLYVRRKAKAAAASR